MSPLDRILGQLGETRREAARRGRRAGDEVLGRRSPIGGMLLALGGAAVGAAVAFLFDPDRGRGRRARYGDQLAALVRHGIRSTGRGLRATAATVGGAVTAARHAGGHGQTDLDDAALADKVETILFRDASVDKGRINVNAERGIVVLRGEVDSPEQRDELEERVGRIGGVWSVHNLLHVPGEPAPDLVTSR